MSPEKARKKADSYARNQALAQKETKIFDPYQSDSIYKNAFKEKYAELMNGQLPLFKHG